MSVADEDCELVGEEAEVVLDCVSGHVEDWSGLIRIVGVFCGSGRTGRHDCGVEVDWIPEACELYTWLPDAHCPAHAFDCGVLFVVVGWGYVSYRFYTRNVVTVVLLHRALFLFRRSNSSR